MAGSGCSNAVTRNLSLILSGSICLALHVTGFILSYSFFTGALAPPPHSRALSIAYQLNFSFPIYSTHIPESHVIHLDPMPVLELITGVNGMDKQVGNNGARGRPQCPGRGRITGGPSPSESQDLREGDEWRWGKILVIIPGEGLEGCWASSNHKCLL